MWKSGLLTPCTTKTLGCSWNLLACFAASTSSLVEGRLIFSPLSASTPEVVLRNSSRFCCHSAAFAADSNPPISATL
jgi:hypothetical protein